MHQAQSGTVISVNISEQKGTLKKPVPLGIIQATGIQGDAHGGYWHRQVSLLSQESIAQFAKQAGKPFQPGEFAENLTTSGLDLTKVFLRDRLHVGAVTLEITQIGKECHGDGCAIFREVGKCVMPKEGIFTRVLQGGEIRPGDRIVQEARPVKICVITLSDRASRGQYQDRSGPAIRERLAAHFTDSHWSAVTENVLIPDEAEQLKAAIHHAVKEGADIIFTTGGTGIGARDITPDVVTPLLTRVIPGIMEYIRMKYGAALPAALLSRSVAGLIHSTLVLTLPGSVKAVNEYMTEICRILNHSLLMLMDIDSHGPSGIDAHSNGH